MKRALRHASKHSLAQKRERGRLSKALRRQWLTGILLQRGLWTVAQIAETLGVSKATCQRDLDLLAELFVVRTLPDPHHSQRSCYRMDVAFKPALGGPWQPLRKRRLKEAFSSARRATKKKGRSA